MSNTPADKETKPADPLTEADVSAAPESAAPYGDHDDHDDPEEEIRRREESLDERAGREELKRTQSYVTDTSTVTRTTTRLSVPAQSKKPWYKTPNPLLWGSVPPVPKERQESREASAGFFSKLTFQWMAPLMNAGYKRPLEHGDLWTVNPKRSVDRMAGKCREAFERRIKNGDKYPLLWALHETFFWEFWIGGMCQLTAAIFQVLSPFVLRFLIAFAQEAWNNKKNGQPPPPIGRGIGLAVGITFMQVFQSLGINHFIYRGMMIGGQVRAVLISLIFEKSMVISNRAKAGGKAAKNSSTEQKSEEDMKEDGKKDKKAGTSGVAGDGVGWSNGRVVNLMSVDTYRLDQSSALFHIIWTAPIQCIITLVVLLINLSYSALAGFAVLVIGIPALTRAIRSLFRRRGLINKITDRRVTLTQEILQSVRFVKYFGWEAAFVKRLEAVRDQEIHGIQVLLAIRNAINSVSLSLPIYASFLSFITYSLTDHGLGPAEVFSSLALFNSLRLPLNLLPLVIGNIVDAWSSIRRIQGFMLSEDQEDTAVFNPETKNAVEVNNASFTWERTPTQENDKKAAGGKGAVKKGANQPAKTEKGSTDTSESNSDTASTLVEEREPFKLEQLNLAVGRKELIAVIGSVGSGKTSLLAALAGDMRKTSGEVILGASRAFCPQYAWIQNASVRQNILFGKDMNRGWYNEVVKACALQPDLDMLPDSDATEIGERGITVSGGQKQRLNIARAIYFDADIVLMDDPLSAVDAHVGRHIMDNAILGLLKDKCRILATHQLWVLNRCDRIVWMDGGKIRAVDTYDNLMTNEPSFRLLMETSAVHEKKEEDDVAIEEKSAGTDRKKKKKGRGLMQAEERAVSSVPWSVYASYVRASGSIFNAVLVFIALVVSQGGNIATSLWLSYWTADKFGYSQAVYIGVYAALGTAQAIFLFLFAIMLTIFGTRASKALLHQAVTRTLRAPMSFFDTTPLGRITNRFSRDVDVMDNNLTDAMRMYFLTLVTIISVFALIIAFFYYFAIALVPLALFFVLAASYYRSSAREVKRFESVLRSVVFAKFSEGISGVASIRAYGLQGRFATDLRNAIDDMNSAYYLTFSNQRWLSVRLDLIGNLLVFTTGILVVTSRFSVPPSIGGLVLSYILSIVQMLQFTVRQLAEVENGMNAVERLLHYGTQLEEEAPEHTIDIRPSWPEKGEIAFDNVEMRYRANLPLVLKGLSMHVKGGERIGIVGRTGAGKSSIMSTLFRLVEISAGHITIDGIDIATIGLHDLRSRLAIIPQDPTLFHGTVRSNLDPFSEHSDLELWSALRQADLVAADAGPNDKDPGRIHLDSVVEEDGLNFSLGQRQLMALARALVRGSRIIVCDEATSSVDMETDDKIQKTMAAGFRGRTLLCIAHRLRTIVGYDRICVMDAGRIAELGTPLELWAMEGGIFRGMCERSGIRHEDLVAAARGGSATGSAPPPALEGEKEDRIEPAGSP
ncbi:P-loop containing nucleoside triphosphate hydrolase protein [Xylaria palmicola]|nr:P-loop containing nucleoside triphosphate hydrolase protein [Xylaria palmicola]